MSVETVMDTLLEAANIVEAKGLGVRAAINRAAPNVVLRERALAAVAGRSGDPLVVLHEAAADQRNPPEGLTDG